MDFKLFKNAVAKQFQTLTDSGFPLFRTEVTKDELWDTYLNSFPEGTNPLYRVKNEYDCSACHSFIKAVGNLVAVNPDNVILSIWDLSVDEPAYQTVADALAKLVKSKPIANIFLHRDRVAGVDKNFEAPKQKGQKKHGEIKRWEHFFVKIPSKYVLTGEKKGEKYSETLATFDVCNRGLKELSMEAINTVLDLISQNSLYRGEEHKDTVQAFKNMKNQYINVSAEKKETFVWAQTLKVSHSVARIRNTAIGSLLIDLSEDRDLEEAVKSFEEKVAPTNYKRPTALVTKIMIENAEKRVTELGLETALARRYANLTDISINDIIFADRETKKDLSGNVFAEMMKEAPDKKPKNMKKIEEVGIEKFIKDIVPQASGIELMFEGCHIKNLVSIIAPQDQTAGKMFKWDNNFSWAYNGDVADSLREKVKKAGGNVSGDLCCRLAWYNYDDLDLHMIEPDGNEIYYRNCRGSLSRCGGMLDVDMNAGQGTTREPVENIFYGSCKRMLEGTYKLFVHQYAKRENDSIGFEAEIDFMGETYHFAYDKAVKQNENIVVAEIQYSRKNGVKLINTLPTTIRTREIWGITTNTYHKVNLLMYSPNHWESSGSGIGNKHYMFMLDGCKNPDTARGFFNEFLREEFNAERKVFEIVGNKMKAVHTENQLSGLGFSSTNRASVLCRVSGSFNRVIKIIF